jgi:hypothetical protein
LDNPTLSQAETKTPPQAVNAISFLVREKIPRSSKLYNARRRLEIFAFAALVGYLVFGAGLGLKRLKKTLHIHHHNLMLALRICWRSLRLL